MEELLKAYLQDVLGLSRPKIRHINQNYINTNTVTFTYTHEHSFTTQDHKITLNLWDLLVYTFSKTVINDN